MRKTPTIALLILFFLTSGKSKAIGIEFIGQNHSLYQLETRLMKGEKPALLEIANYFDSEVEVIEFLGYHRLESTESLIAKRIFVENTLFTDEEFSMNDSTTTKRFTDFFIEHEEQIIFSELANAFLITPLNEREVNFEIRAVSEMRREALKNDLEPLLRTDWVKRNNIDELIAERNPQALLKISSGLFKIRSRFNRYHSNEDEFTDLLQYLTGIVIGVENEAHEISWHIEKDYNPASKLNLLIYFAKYYKQFTWNKTAARFVNPNHKIKELRKEDYLFQHLANENDSIALDAFIQLTTCNPSIVTELATEYHSARIDVNYIVPSFTFRFLKQLVLLTDFCKTNQIDFVGSSDLKRNITLLQSQLTFQERRRLEDQLIQSLTLDEITAFEYWALIHQNSWTLTYSAGRILDIFYSKNWDALLANQNYLECYLKKSILFDNLGIIGVCNNYHKKFSNTSETTLNRIRNIAFNDTTLQYQIEKIISTNNNLIAEENDGTTSWNGNKNHTVKNLKSQLNQLTHNVKDSSETETLISELLSQINYRQIPIALVEIEDYPFKMEWKKYSFMKRDWGFFMTGDFAQKETRDEFLNLYAQHSEYELYTYYMDRSEIDYRTNDSLDFDKIYELLKYNVVVAFVGGGGGSQDNEVYALVKLLELTFNTTLGYPDKLCNSNNMYACSADKRARSWMTYLTENKLLKQKHDAPVSFHYR